MPHRELRLARFDHRQHAVVGRDEDVILGLGENRAALAAHSRVDHDDMRGARRKEAIRLRDGPRAVEDVVGRDGVADVHNARFRLDVQHHAMHDADESVVESKVSGEGDDAWLGHAGKLAGASERSQVSIPVALHIRGFRMFGPIVRTGAVFTPSRPPARLLRTRALTRPETDPQAVNAERGSERNVEQRQE